MERKTIGFVRQNDSRTDQQRQMSTMPPASTSGEAIGFPPRKKAQTPPFEHAWMAVRSPVVRIELSAGLST